TRIVISQGPISSATGMLDSLTRKASREHSRQNDTHARRVEFRPPLNRDRSVIILFLTTRNEAELLRLNLAHHLKWGFDHVAVADNESTDGTQDVLGEFGDVVTSMRIGDPYERYRALAELLTKIEERHGAVDWVAVSDTDEFWWTPDWELGQLLSRVPD